VDRRVEEEFPMTFSRLRGILRGTRVRIIAPLLLVMFLADKISCAQFASAYPENGLTKDQFITELTGSNAPVLGDALAPVTIVEFVDFQCPDCKQFAATIERDLLPRYPKMVKVVFRNLPLRNHAWSVPAAELTACIAQQSTPMFWAAGAFIFAQQNTLTKETIGPSMLRFVNTHPAIGRKRYLHCVATRATRAVVDADLTFAQINNITLTPTVFVNGVRIQDDVSARALESVIDHDLHQNR
jgi:protein-disulfide isomerase